MQRIKILVVDDSVVIRRMLRDVFASDPVLEVAGVAANGKIAMAMLDQVQPDLVTLDIEMPEMDGLATLDAIRKTRRTLPVIMFSTLTARGAAATIEAFSRGATDYVTKPADAKDFATAVEQVKNQLVPKVKALCGQKVASIRSTQFSLKPARSHSYVKPAVVEAIVIGTSTGGPNALGVVLPNIPAKIDVPILIVQHMPPLFTRFLADRLTSHSRIGVTEGVDGELLSSGHAWLAPGDHHMTVCKDGTRVRIATNQRAPENFCRPSVDVLFRSAADVYGPGLLAVVMTGMGQDGLAGCEHIRKNGGRIFVQDEATSVVWGMPGFIARAGLADKVLPLEQIGPEVARAAMDRHDTAELAGTGR